jgi:hypothetical protein
MKGCAALSGERHVNFAHINLNSMLLMTYSSAACNCFATLIVHRFLVLDDKITPPC